MIRYYVDYIPQVEYTEVKYLFVYYKIKSIIWRRKRDEYSTDKRKS